MSIELTPELSPEFAVTVRGYDRAQVDEYIDWLREWLSNATVRMESAETEAAQFRDQLRRLQLRVDDLEVETSDRPPRTIGALGERMTRILELAEEGAAAVRADAESEAERLLSEARAEADDLVRATQARQAELDGLLAGANEQAQKTVQEAEARAAETAARQMLESETRAHAWESQAQQRARELVESAEQERARILEQLMAEKAALDAHLEGLVAQRTQVLASLSRLHESLASTIVELPAPGGSRAEQEPETDLRSDATGPNPFGDGVDLGDPNPEAGSGSGRPAAGFRHSAGAGDSATPGAGDSAAPGAGDNAAPGAGDNATPGAGDNAAPGTAGTHFRPGPAGQQSREDPDREDQGRTVLFDREAVEEEQPPPPAPSFRRAGSKPEGSQRAGE